MYHLDDTIAAIASAPGGAARGIVRLSGPSVRAVLERCFHSAEGHSLANVTRATVVRGAIDLPADWPGVNSTQLPAEVYFWPNPRSYTCQPLAEIHTIGSPPLLSAVLRRVCESGARLAEPGEFTLRAFLAGRIDLTQAEAVLGVIDAHGQREFQTALTQLAGGMARPLAALRESLLDLLAEIEAGLDFVEEDIQFIAPERVEGILSGAIAAVDEARAQLTLRSETRAAVRAVLVGRPNVGKSSLFNALSAEGALVSSQPGTTRDYLLATLDLDGVRCHLIDTAGVDPHSSEGLIDAAAQHASLAQADDCEVQLLCLDSTRPLDDWERQQLAVNPAAARLVLLTKCDQTSRPVLEESGPEIVIQTSATQGTGLGRLRQALGAALVEIERNEAASSLTAERCGQSLEDAGRSLARARDLHRGGGSEELIAAEVRVSLAELGKVVGAVYTDDILDRIFSRFCIGK